MDAHESAHEPGLHSSLAQTEHGRSLLGRELFQITQNQDFAIVVTEFGQCRLHALAQLCPAQPFTGAGAARHQPVDQIKGGFVGQGSNPRAYTRPPGKPWLS